MKAGGRVGAPPPHVFAYLVQAAGYCVQVSVVSLSSFSKVRVEAPAMAVSLL